jgi:hypothetical protein
MNPPRFASIRAVLALAALGGGCSSEPAPAAPPADPSRCELKDLGEASTLIETGNLPADQLARLSGVGDPRSLVRQDSVTKQAYFLTRVMGTQRRLFYMQELATGETPKVLAVFEGRLQRWDLLPPQQAVPIANALKQEYQIDIDPRQTYLITADAKPDGCP